jgi:hypothetical protein
MMMEARKSERLRTLVYCQASGVYMRDRGAPGVFFGPVDWVAGSQELLVKTSTRVDKWPLAIPSWRVWNLEVPNCQGVDST